MANDKIKKKEGDLSIPVERTEDILGTIGPRKTHQFLCGFSMETRDLVENSSAKLAKKNLDMVVANNLKVAGAGFGDFVVHISQNSQKNYGSFRKFGLTCLFYSAKII